ncbi:MAG: hypothetical protein ACRD21_13975, partial [Vicinamibacteria bacterium]
MEEASPSRSGRALQLAGGGLRFRSSSTGSRHAEWDTTRCSKGILRRFFREFLELFFPEFAARLDFESLEFPDKELFKGFPDGAPREPDVVARVRSREGSPEIVIVHVEAQSRAEKDFGRRMFEYYALLWLSFDAPVFPV